VAGNSFGEVFRVITFSALTRWQTERMEEVMSVGTVKGLEIGAGFEAPG